VIDPRHPYYFMQDLLADERMTFEFSKYIYVPDTLLDSRDVIRVHGGTANSSWVNKEIDNLETTQELAFHSIVKINKRSFHIPMIDFAIETSLDRYFIDRLHQYLPRAVFLNLALYTSGRSYHAYSTRLLSPLEWIDFMGRLLLINPRNGPNLIDSRWVGHRLVGGYSALRWSNNSGTYAGLPTRIDFEKLAVLR